MKKALSFSLVLLMLMITNIMVSDAQPFQSIFGKDSTLWSLILPRTGVTPMGGFSIAKTDDTVINGKVYRIVRTRFTTARSSEAAGIREDTTTGRVWTISFSTPGTDKLMMDMTLNMGDTLVGPWQVDSIWVDSLNRKHIGFANIGMELIEGVGMINHFVFVGMMVCSWKDGQHVFQGMPWNGCFPFGQPVGITETAGPAAFTLRPNPAGEVITLSVISPVTYEVLNATGQKLVAGAVSAGHAEINISTLTPGLYFVRVISGAQVGVKSFIKK